MPSTSLKVFAQDRAYKMAGYMVWFREMAHTERRLGRVVGYYYDMAQLVIECSFTPMYTIDPLSNHINITANFRPGLGWKYTLVDVFLVDEEVKAKDARYPHACPKCGSRALVLFRTVECSNGACKHYRA
jgi:hypothetical protein